MSGAWSARAECSGPGRWKPLAECVDRWGWATVVGEVVDQLGAPTLPTTTLLWSHQPDE